MRMRVFAASLPQGAAGQWCRVELRLADASPWWAKIEAEDAARGQIVREAFLGPMRRRGGVGARKIVLHLPASAGALRIVLFCRDGLAQPALVCRRLSRAGAAWSLLRHGWRLLPSALRGDRRGAFGRARAVLGQAPARSGEAPPYAVWLALFDDWRGAPAEALAGACAALPALDVAVAILGEADTGALAATRASLPPPWRAHVITNAGAAAMPARDWLMVLEPGEVLAPHAPAVLRVAVANAPWCRAITADFDHLDASGERSAPHLRPPPDPWLLQSAFFGRGAALFRMKPHAALWPNLPGAAPAARLFLLRGGDADGIRHVPLLLSHCPLPERLPRALPRRVATGRHPMVSILVPSACRSWHVHACLSALLGKTDYADVEILVAVAKVDAADRKQSAVLRSVASLPGVRILDLDLPGFNFSAAINRAASASRGEVLLLLNDDIVPIEPDWLVHMVAYVCQDGAAPADIVGVRLLYGNGRVQHGGVILGLADLCEHAFRFAERDDPGPQGLHHLDRQVSAVTAACCLVRRSTFEQLGGFDEGFAVALNDVDFCLRAAARGARIVMASRIDLVHFESLSLGRHYQGRRAALEAIETRRLRERWPGPIGQDQWYNPCASRELGREFQPAFPPRQTPFSWIAQNALAVL
jgi:GT2 family glycosyltransferase